MSSAAHDMSLDNLYQQILLTEQHMSEKTRQLHEGMLANELAKQKSAVDLAILQQLTQKIILIHSQEH